MLWSAIMLNCTSVENTSGLLKYCNFHFYNPTNTALDAMNTEAEKATR